MGQQTELLLQRNSGQVPRLEKLGWRIAAVDLVGSHVRNIDPAQGTLWKRGLYPDSNSNRLLSQAGLGFMTHKGLWAPTPRSCAQAEAWPLSSHIVHRDFSRSSIEVCNNRRVPCPTNRCRSWRGPPSRCEGSCSGRRHTPRLSKSPVRSPPIPSRRVGRMAGMRRPRRRRKARRRGEEQL